MENTYIYKQQKKLRCGYTTGTCAAAASMAAAAMLLGEEAVEQVSVDLRLGELRGPHGRRGRPGRDPRHADLRPGGSYAS